MSVKARRGTFAMRRENVGPKIVNKYNLEITSKAKYLNIFRGIFKIGPLERLLVTKTSNRMSDSFWVRLMPPNYLYAGCSERKVKRNGINYLLDISDMMEHAVYFGYTETAAQKLFEIALNKRIIIDVGVNIGHTLLNFARLSPGGKIFGFEPDSVNYQKAERNIGLNDFGNISLIKKGVGSKTATARLYRVNEDNAGMNRILDCSADLHNEFDFDEIEIIKLDDFAVENELAQIDLIKIDVEGYELKVLEGAENSLRAYAPTLFIELDDDNLRDQGDSAEKVILFLERFGYKIFRAADESPISGEDDFSNCHFDIICKK